MGNVRRPPVQLQTKYSAMTANSVQNNATRAGTGGTVRPEAMEARPGEISGSKRKLTTKINAAINSAS